MSSRAPTGGGRPLMKPLSRSQRLGGAGTTAMASTTGRQQPEMNSSSTQREMGKRGKNSGAGGMGASIVSSPALSPVPSSATLLDPSATSAAAAAALLSPPSPSSLPPAPTSSPHFRATPSEVHFPDVEAGQVYHLLLTLCNSSTRRKRVRLQPLRTDCFGVEVPSSSAEKANNGLELAPGLTLKLKVYFHAPYPPEQLPTQSDEEYTAALHAFSTRSWHDFLVIVSGEDAVSDRLAIPLHAWSKRAEIEAPSLLDFGTLAASTAATSAQAATATVYLPLINHGSAMGSWRLEFDKTVPLTLTPSSGSLSPHGEVGCETRVKCELRTKMLPSGPYRALGRLYINEEPMPRLIELQATLVEASLQLIWPTLPGSGGTLNLADLSSKQLESVAEVAFGSLYFGEVRKIDAILLNNTPQPLNFLVHLTDARDEHLMMASSASTADARRGAGVGAGAKNKSIRALTSSPTMDAEGRRTIPGSVLGDHDLEGGGNGASSSSTGTSSDAPPSYYRPDMLVSPVEGKLDAYQSTKLTFIFQPRQPRSLQQQMKVGFKNAQLGDGGGESEDGEGAGSSGPALVGPDGAALLREKPEPPYVSYQALCKVESLDGKHKVSTPVLGLANIPAVSLSSDHFEFGSCPVHEQREQYVTLKNLSTELPLAFEFGPLAQFHATPRFGSLAPRQAMRVLLTFNPRNLGVFRDCLLALHLLGSLEGKKPKGLVPRVHATAASIKAAAIPNDALVTVHLALSGRSETIGVNRTTTISAQTGNRTTKTIQPEIKLVKPQSVRQEEKEMEAMGRGEAQVVEDALDGTLSIHPLTSTSPSSHLPDGSKRPFHRSTGWNDPALAGKYAGRWQVTKGSLDNLVTFTPEELEARTRNKEYYESFLKQSRKQRKQQQQVAFAPMELEPVDPQAVLHEEMDKPRDLKGMGLQFASGLKEPDVELPPPADKLKLKYPMAGFEGEGRKRLHKIESQREGKRQVLKAAPSTQAEKRDCDAFLSPEELQCILRSPKLVDFGKLCVRGICTRPFHVTNDLDQHILVELKVTASELSRSTPRSQMVPPGAMATFDIIFCGEREEEWKGSVNYVLNGQHEFNFLCLAEVVPMDLQLSRSEIFFDFKPDNTQFHVSESLTLRNPYTVPASFYWQMPSHLDCFSIHPLKGVVPAGESLKVELRYEPRYANTGNEVTAADLALHIVDGGATAEKKVAVRASLPEASLIFARHQRILDFGSMCVGTPVTKLVHLRNDGATRTVFRFEDIPPHVKVTPIMAKVEVGTSVPVSITVHPISPDFKLKHSLTVAVRGRPKDSKPLRLALKGESFLPSLLLQDEDELAFGGVTLGASRSRMVTLLNTGSVAATLFLDPSRLPDFKVTFEERLMVEQVGEDGKVRPAVVQKVSAAVLKQNQCQNQNQSQGGDSTARALDYGMEDGMSPPNSTPSSPVSSGGYPSDLGNGVGGYSLHLSPNSSVSFTLTFTPTRVIDHVYELPLSISGIPHYPELRRVISAHGLRPKLALSTSQLDLGKAVVLKKALAHKNAYRARFTLRNEDAQTVRWHLALRNPTASSEPGTPTFNAAAAAAAAGIHAGAAAATSLQRATPEFSGFGSNLDDVVAWRVEPTAGALQPGQEIDVVVYFSPTQAQTYNCPVDIFLDEPASSSSSSSAAPPSDDRLSLPSSATPYTSLTLSGVGTTPRLLFSVDEVVLPLVPLGIKAQATFHLKNDGYENLELNHQLSMDSTRAPITIKMPQGSTLSASKTSIPVEVVLLAKKPVSFTVQLHFFDSEGTRFSIPITGTSDNSTLTVQHYLETHPDQYEIVVQQPSAVASTEEKPTGSKSSHHQPQLDKVLTLVELTKESIQARRRAAEGARQRKSIYDGLQPMIMTPPKKGSRGSISKRKSSHTDFDFAGAHQQYANISDGEDMLSSSERREYDSYTPGAMTRRGSDESRLTPLRRLPHSHSSGGGDSLYSHTLESVLSYLHASRLLHTGMDMEDEDDSPPAFDATTGSLSSSAAALAHKRRSSTTGLTLSLSAQTFPAELVKTHGQTIRRLLRHLTGMTVPTEASKKKAAFGGNRDKLQTTISLQPHTSAATQAAHHTSAHASVSKSDELLLTIYHDYEELLIFLKAQGCLLGGVRPWHLLSWTQLLRLLSLPAFTELGSSASMSPLELSTRQRKLEKDFPSLQRTGWLTILIQIIKVFILARVTMQSFKALPGMSPELACMSYSFANSNIYTVGECILLEWMSFHYHRVNPLHPRPVLNFQSDLSDCLVLAGVFQSHIPHLVSIQQMRTHVTSSEDCMYNASKILMALQEVGLRYHITPNQLVNAPMRDMVLFGLFLYQQLPHFVPKSSIEFVGALGQELVQCIELTNPSASKAITYNVHLSGSADFKVERLQVRLAPRGKQGSTCKFPVRFKARFSRAVEARLVFSPASPSPASGEDGTSSFMGGTASPLVFLLKSHVQSRTPLHSYTCNARVYEPQSIDVRVTNPFASNVECTFLVQVKIDVEPHTQANKGQLQQLSAVKDMAALSQAALEAINDSAASGRGSARVLGAGGHGSGSHLSNPVATTIAGGGPSSSTTSRPLGSTRSNQTSRSQLGAGERLPPSFFCAYEKIKLKGGETQSLPIQFLALRMGAYRAQLIFLDEQVGEFMIQLNCVALPPAPLELFRWNTSTTPAASLGGVSSSSDSKSVQLAYRNPLIDQARSATFDRIRNLTREQRDQKKMRSDWGDQILKPDFMPINQPIQYHVHCTSPFFVVTPQQITLHDIKLEREGMAAKARAMAANASSSSSGGGAASKRGALVITDLNTPPSSKGDVGFGSASSLSSAYLMSSKPDNRLHLNFHPRGGPGVYRGEVVLTSLYDTRVYALEVHVQSEEDTPTLEFAVPARQTVTQQIPLSLSPQAEQVPTLFKATITHNSNNSNDKDHKSSFTGPSEVTVQPGPQGGSTYPLSFSPSWLCEVSGTLILHNTRTDEKLSFHLHGVGIEPLAERHVRLEVSARSTLEHRLAVTNNSPTDLVYTVESDLQSFEGAPQHKVGAAKTVDYVFTLSPSTSGTFLGAITFHTADKRFQWYSVEVVVQPPDAESDVSLACEARQVLQVSLPISNPTDATLPLEVYLEGVGVQGGVSSLELAPKETRPYAFVYAPLLPTPSTGPSPGALRFTSPSLGIEFWYRLHLTATSPLPHAVTFGEVEVGKSASVEVWMENHTAEPTVVRGVVDNQTSDFTFKPTGNIVLPPHGRASATLTYTPSSLSQPQRTALTFSSPLLGAWVFECSGVGAKPSPMPVTFVSTPVGSQLSRTLTFRNPFPHKLKVDVELEERNPHGPQFMLYLKRSTGLVVAGGGSVQLPFLFSPQLIADHTAAIRVVASEADLVWVYPLRGAAEGHTIEQSIELQCQARERISVVKELQLVGLPNPMPQPEHFQVDIEMEGESAETAEADALLLQRVRKSLHLHLLNPVLDDPDTPLRVQCDLSPLVPFKLTALHRGCLVLSKVSGEGGRWKFPLLLTVSPPEPDDVIRIEAAVQATSSVAFRLHNYKSTPTPFTARLSLDSSAHFACYPPAGVFAAVSSPDEDPGVQFLVSFSPKEYGKPQHAQLLIECSGMCYVYQLVGTQPRYQPPQGQSTLQLQQQRGGMTSVTGSVFGSGGVGAGSLPSSPPRRPVNHVAQNIRALKDMQTMAQKSSQVRAWKGV